MCGQGWSDLMPLICTSNSLDDAIANASCFACTLGNFGNKRRPLPVYLSVSTLMTTAAFRAPHIEASREKGNAMSNVLDHWIPVGCDAYDENVFMPWIKESLQRRTVALRRACF